MATCQLCGRTGKGNVKGHIIPAWAYEMTSGFDKEFQVGSKEAGYDSPHILESTNRSKLRITEPMFCEKTGEGCDHLIGKGEEEIKKVFIEALPNSFKNIQGKFPYKVIQPTRYGLITRGIAGILLKCYLSNKFDIVTHFNKDNKEMIAFLKRAILDDGISSRTIKLSTTKICTNVDEFGRGTQTAGYIHAQPFPGEKMFILIFGGLAFIVFIDESSTRVNNEIPVFAEHLESVKEHSFVKYASSFYTQKYISIIRKLFLLNYTIKKLFPLNYTKIFQDANYFKELANPASHSLLTPEWLKKNSTSIRCFCGNLTKNKRARVRDSCCGKFWQQ